MKTTRAHILFCRALFVIGLFCTACCFLDSWHEPLFFNFKARGIKVILAFAVPAVLTALDYFAERNFSFISIACAVMMNLCLLLYFADKYTVNLIARLGQSQIIFHFMYALISFFTVLVTAWLCTVADKQHRGSFGTLFYRFSWGYLPLCIFLFILQFFILRKFGDIGVSSNFILFNGEIRCLIYYLKSGTLTDTVLLHSAGNVLYFTSLALILCGIFRKHPAVWGTAIPVLLSVFIETFQYLTKCGDADVDDILLNSIGALLGVMAYQLFIKKYSTEEKLCLE